MDVASKRTLAAISLNFSYKQNGSPSPTERDSNVTHSISYDAYFWLPSFRWPWRQLLVRQMRASVLHNLRTSASDC